MTTIATARASSGPRRAAAAALVSLAVSGALVACSGEEESPSGPAAPTSSAPPPLTTTSKLGVVDGRIRPREQERAVTKVTTVVDGWFDAAYVAGDYPRDDFADAFPGFTPGAADLARQDARLMTNADLGTRIDSVEAVGRRVVVDLLGVRGAAAAATARVRLAFVTDGDVRRRVTVTGRLRLVRQKDGWRVFAYDVAMGREAVGTEADQ